MMRMTVICKVARSLRIVDHREVISDAKITVAVIYLAFPPSLRPSVPLPLVDTISLKLGDSNLGRERGTEGDVDRDCRQE